MAVIDWDQFNENFQYYDKETIQEVIKDFFEETEERMIQLEKIISERDFAKLAFNAHSLKSVIGNFMAPKPYEMCRQLETMGKQNEGNHLEEVFSELKGLIGELTTDLKSYLRQ